DWSTRAPDDRLIRHRRVLENGEGPPARGSPDDQATRTLDVFKAIGECRARFGDVAIGPYIISMAEGAEDVLAVLALARWGGGELPRDRAGRGHQREVRLARHRDADAGADRERRGTRNRPAALTRCARARLDRHDGRARAGQQGSLSRPGLR